MDALAAERGSCEEACLPAECCYEKTTESCQASKLLMCLDYAPCQNLRDDAVIVPAPENLDEICLSKISGDEADFGLCDDTCAKASCCVDLDLGDNCLSTDFINCLTYASCAFWTLELNTDVVPPAPEELTEVCSIDSLMSEVPTREECSTLCEPASCCTEFGEDNCFASDPFGCGEYATCILLDLTGGDLSPAPETITDICTLENVFTEEGHDDCEEMCGPAACCTQLGDDNCLAEGNVVACAGYVPCLFLMLTDGDIGMPPDDIGDYCKDGMDESELDQCQAECDKSKCCWSFTGNCFFGNFIACTAYGIACAPLL